MNDIIKIIKWLEDSYVLIDGVTKTVKHEWIQNVVKLRIKYQILVVI